jgi:hypothetical protein
MKLPAIIMSLLFFGLIADLLASPEKNGFDLSNSLIPDHKILSGGPNKDVYPLLITPNF